MTILAAPLGSGESIMTLTYKMSPAQKQEQESELLTTSHDAFTGPWPGLQWMYIAAHLVLTGCSGNISSPPELGLCCEPCVQLLIDWLDITRHILPHCTCVLIGCFPSPSIGLHDAVVDVRTSQSLHSGLSQVIQQILAFCCLVRFSVLPS